VLAQHGSHGALTLSVGALVAVMLLGAFHGLNPGMGWLFAVSYGLQERSMKALLGSMVPIVIGHELSVAPIAVAIVVFSSELSRAVAASVFAAVLIGFGVFLLLRKRHFRWVGMRLTPWQLGWWSFLMSTATGAGLMLAPVLLGGRAIGQPLMASTLPGDIVVAVLATLLHALAMIVTSAVLAMLVYRVIGLRILRTAWVNLDRIWAAAFIIAGVFLWVR
jgi:hypothetical protein